MTPETDGYSPSLTEDEKAEAKRKDEERTILLSFQTTFASPAGQRVLKHLFTTYCDRPSFVPGDPHSTSFLEGERNIYRAIVKAINKAKHLDDVEEKPDVKAPEDEIEGV